MTSAGKNIIIIIELRSDQVLLLAVATTRFLNPYAEIIFTPVLIVRRRDRKDCLLMRLGHSLGHLLTNVQIQVSTTCQLRDECGRITCPLDMHVQARYVRPYTTLVGEMHWRSEPISFYIGSTFVSPIVVSHQLEEGSSLFADIQQRKLGDHSKPGFITVDVTGHDAGRTWNA